MAEGRKSKDFLNRSRVFRLNWIKIRSLRSVVLNRLFSQNKDTTRQQESMVIHALTYELQVQDILDNFNSSSRTTSTSAIFCSYSSAVLGVFSRLLRMALLLFTLASNSYFFCLTASGIWARVNLRWSIAAFTFSSSFSSSARLISS